MLNTESKDPQRWPEKSHNRIACGVALMAIASERDIAQFVDIGILRRRF